MALDRWTGDEIWATEPVGSSHSSPVLLEILGQPQVVFISAFSRTEGQIAGFDPETGETLWQSNLYQCRLPIPYATSVADNRLFVTGGYEAGSVMLEFANDDDGIVVKEIFRSQRGSQIHQPILLDDHLYVVVNENKTHERRFKPEGGLMCLDLNGEEKWRTGEEPFLGRGTLLYADGYLLSQDGFNGTLRVIKPSPDGYECVAEADIFGIEGRSDEQLWAPMALSNGHLLLRSQDELKCVDLRSKDA